MKFMRFVTLNIETELDDKFTMQLPESLNEISIENMGNYLNGSKTTSLWKFEKNIESCDLTLINKALDINGEYINEFHNIIRFFASFVSVIYQIKLTIGSTIPSFALLPENSDEKEKLDNSKGVMVNRKTINGEDFTFEINGDSHKLVCDRPNGLEVLSEALRLNSNLAKYREYVRLFELAFSHAGVGLYKPLLRFLTSGGSDFTKTEVRFWFDELRSRAIHSDKEEPVFGYEIVKSIERMKLAAYDVLFNKEQWGNHDHTRRNGMTPISGPGFLTQGKEARLHMYIYDDFGVFPVNLSISTKGKMPEGCWYKALKQEPMYRKLKVVSENCNGSD